MKIPAFNVTLQTVRQGNKQNDIDSLLHVIYNHTTNATAYVACYVEKIINVLLQSICN